jgi:hypothetical protein
MRAPGTRIEADAHFPWIVARTARNEAILSYKSFILQHFAEVKVPGPNSTLRTIPVGFRAIL